MSTGKRQHINPFCTIACALFPHTDNVEDRRRFSDNLLKSILAYTPAGLGSASLVELTKGLRHAMQNINYNHSHLVADFLRPKHVAAMLKHFVFHNNPNNKLSRKNYSSYALVKRRQFSAEYALVNGRILIKPFVALLCGRWNRIIYATVRRNVKKPVYAGKTHKDMEYLMHPRVHIVHRDLTKIECMCIRP